MKKFETKEKVKVNKRYLDKFEYFTLPDDVLYWWTNEEYKEHVILWHGCLHTCKDDEIFHIWEKIPTR